jgi:flavorubredoxin
MKELKFQKKKAAAFGCYGWSGESVDVINKAWRMQALNSLIRALKTRGILKQRADSAPLIRQTACH